MLPTNQILLGDALEHLQQLPDESIDLVVTDPPYGYSFMNKAWDKAVVSTEVWKECLRVLKAGAFAFIMSAPRQDVLSRMIVNLQDAGFRTDFTSIYWTYASGFPKTANVSKLVDKRAGEKRKVIGQRQDILIKQSKDFERGYRKIKDSYDSGAPSRNNGFKTISANITKPATEQAKRLDGSYAGFQPKPAVEVILVVMKPLSEKTFVDQALKNGKGITWLDSVRIPFKDENDIGDKNRFINPDKLKFPPSKGWNQNNMKNLSVVGDKGGRFPANLLVSDDSLNDGKIRPCSGRPNSIGKKYKLSSNEFFREGHHDFIGHYMDSGSYSRYFDLDAWYSAQFIITPKASASERNKGLSDIEPTKVNDGRKTPIDNPFQRGETQRHNTHPTVKPLKLFSYLITMGSRPNYIILDPFIGSGTTAIAAHQLNRKFIGIEKNPEYYEIAQKRIKPYLVQQKII